MITGGASAQPMLPVSPWAENAGPRRDGVTVALRIAKSAGWNTALPRPPSAAQAISTSTLGAKPIRATEADISAVPPTSTGMAPKRSTAKPAMVWARPETT